MSFDDGFQDLVDAPTLAAACNTDWPLSSRAVMEAPASRSMRTSASAESPHFAFVTLASRGGSPVACREGVTDAPAISERWLLRHARWHKLREGVSVFWFRTSSVCD